MKPGALLAVLGAGFLFGFLWGARTRDALATATQTNYADGVITVKVDAGQALSAGLAATAGNITSSLNLTGIVTPYNS